MLYYICMNMSWTTQKICIWSTYSLYSCFLLYVLSDGQIRRDSSTLTHPQALFPFPSPWTTTPLFSSPPSSSFLPTFLPLVVIHVNSIYLQSYLIIFFSATCANSSDREKKIDTRKSCPGELPRKNRKIFSSRLLTDWPHALHDS